MYSKVPRAVIRLSSILNSLFGQAEWSCVQWAGGARVADLCEALNVPNRNGPLE